jgi:hypothetical protein
MPQAPEHLFFFVSPGYSSPSFLVKIAFGVLSWVAIL